MLLLFGLLTLGLGLPLLGVLPFVPFCYHIAVRRRPALRPRRASRLLGLVVRRNDDLGRPTPCRRWSSRWCSI